MLAAACGGDSKPANATAVSKASPSSGITAVTGGTKAAEMVPALDDLGYAVAQQGKDPAASPNQDFHVVIFQKKDGTQRGVAIRLYAFADEAAAGKQYATLADALKNPPPGFFGGDAKQVDGTPVGAADEKRSYVTAAVDSQGNLIWTDVYRFGRVVAVVQVLEKGDSQQVPVRTAVAERVRAKVR